MVNDAVSDMISQIKNGYMAGKNEVVLPWSKLKEVLVKLLVAEKYLKEYKIETNGVKKLVLVLKYVQKQPAVTEIRRMSRPSLRLYVGKNDLPRVLGGMGTAIISTPMGVMTDKEARKKNLGGEVIAEVW